MRNYLVLSLSVAALLFSAPAALSQGPDVISHRVGYDGSNSNDFRYYGQSGGIAAYSIATQSCNIGTQVLDWYGNGVRHPVIAQNMYRLKDGVFEQLGQSWLKHSFCALSEPGCGNCQATNCDTLGIGCADTYWASLNDGGSGGPKYQVNALDGSHTHPYDSPSGTSSIRGRLQVATSDMDPAQNAGAEYFVECQYIAKDDHEAGNATNNASWRPINVNSVNSITGNGVTVTQEAGIYAWAANDPNVSITKVTNINEMGSGLNGTFYVAYAVTNNGNGTYHADAYIRTLGAAATACFGNYSHKSDTCQRCPIQGPCINFLAAELSRLTSVLKREDEAEVQRLAAIEARKQADADRAKAAAARPAAAPARPTAAAPAPAPVGNFDGSAWAVDAARDLIAKAESTCPNCNKPVKKGQKAMWLRAVKVVGGRKKAVLFHKECGPPGK